MPRDGVSLIDLQLHAQEERQRYLDNIDFYLELIKEVTSEEDPDSRVLVFGSYVKGEMRIDSDVDVLIITHLAEDTEERVRLRVRIARGVGIYSPFEFHIATREEYNNWYKNLIEEYMVI
ncbi:MAG: nucleotidyltransferase domain-containing protein [Candidatus Bathyarchaeia archaeon]